MPVQAPTLLSITSVCPVLQDPRKVREARGILVSRDTAEAQRFLEELQRDYPTVALALVPPRFPEKASDRPSIRPSRDELAAAYREIMTKYFEALERGSPADSAFYGALAERLLRSAAMTAEENAKLLQSYGTEVLVTMPPPVPPYFLRRMTATRRPVVASLVRANYAAASVAAGSAPTAASVIEALEAMAALHYGVLGDFDIVPDDAQLREQWLREPIVPSGSDSEQRTWSLISQLGRGTIGVFPMYAPMYVVLRAASLVQSGEFGKLAAGGAGTLTNQRKLLAELAVRNYDARSRSRAVLSNLGRMPYADEAMANWGARSMRLVGRIASAQETATEILRDMLPREDPDPVRTTGIGRKRNAAEQFFRYRELMRDFQRSYGRKIAASARFANQLPLVSLDCMSDQDRLNRALTAIDRYLRWAARVRRGSLSAVIVQPIADAETETARARYMRDLIGNNRDVGEALEALGELRLVRDCLPRIQALEAALGEDLLEEAIAVRGNRFVVADPNAFVRLRYLIWAYYYAIRGELPDVGGEGRREMLTLEEMGERVAFRYGLTMTAVTSEVRQISRGSRRRPPRYNRYWHIVFWDGSSWRQLDNSWFESFMQKAHDLQTRRASEVAKKYFAEQVANGIVIEGLAYELLTRP